MNYRQYFDAFQEVQPAYTEVRFRDMLNNAQREFCDLTHVLRTSATLTHSGSGVYPLPTDLVRIDELYVDGRKADRIVKRPEDMSGDGTVLVWHMDAPNDQVLLGYQDDGVLVADDDVVVTVTYRAYPTAFDGTDESAESDVPTEFHEALRAKVLSLLYAGKENLQMAAYWFRVYENYVRRAIIQVNSGKGPKSYQVLVHEY